MTDTRIIDRVEAQRLHDEKNPLEPVDVPAPHLARVADLTEVIKQMAFVLHSTGRMVAEASEELLNLADGDDLLFDRYLESSGMTRLVGMVGELAAHFADLSPQPEWLDEFRARYGVPAA